MPTYTFEYGGKKYLNINATDALAASVPQTIIDRAVYDALLLQVKAECRKRIYSRASAETQMNMATAAAAISGKAEADRTKDEAAVLVGIKAALDWVGAMRARVVALADDPETDFTLDESWPECPPELAVLTEQF